MKSKLTRPIPGDVLRLLDLFLFLWGSVTNVWAESGFRDLTNLDVKICGTGDIQSEYVIEHLNFDQ